jgi:ankyrin repeat protein
MHFPLFFAILLAAFQASPVEEKNKALLKAVEAGDAAAVNKLLAEGANANMRERTYPVLVYAFFSGRPSTPEVVTALLKAGADPNAAGSDTKAPPQLAAERGDVHLMSPFLDNGVSPDWANRNRESLLAFAAANGHAAMVRYLLERGAKADVQDDEGFTPLMNACQNRHVEIVRILLEKGAGRDLKSKYGDTAMSLVRGKHDDTQAGRTRKEISELLAK